MTHIFYTPTQLYRRLHLGNAGDTDVYLRAASGARDILDLGCGWGRTSLALAQQGYFVSAVDLEPEFLEELKLRAAQLNLTNNLQSFRQDIRHLLLDNPDGTRKTFDRILIPYNTLYALGGAEQVASCLRQVRLHLKPEGELWFDVYDMDEFHSTYDANDIDPDEDEPVASWDTPAGLVEVLERTEVNHLSKRLLVTYTALLSDKKHHGKSRRGQAKQLGELKLDHHYLLTDQLETLIEGVGLQVRGRFLGSELLVPFDNHPLPATQPELSDEEENGGPIFYVASFASPH